jgi:hypothetical protein
MGQIIGFLKTFKIAVDLVNEFYRLWVKHEIEQIKNDLTKKERARHAIINSINEAIIQRDSEKLIALNHALHLVEYAKL